jgi:hypothetical protein
MRWFLENAVVRVLRVYSGRGGAGLWGLAGDGQFREYPLSFDTGVRTAMRQMQSPMWASLFLTVHKPRFDNLSVDHRDRCGIIFVFMRWFRPLLLLMLVMSGQGALDHGFKWLIARPRRLR